MAYTKKLYSYDGPVMRFENCIQDRWIGSTYAESESLARRNLVYQYKKAAKLAPTAKITLPGKIQSA